MIELKKVVHQYLENIYAESFDIKEIDKIDQSFRHLGVYYSVISIKEANLALRGHIENIIEEQLREVSEIIINNINIENCINDFLKSYDYNDIFEGIVYQTNDYIIIEH